MESQATERLVQAYRLQQSGQLDAAEKLYRSILEGQPDNVHALNLLGVVCVKTKRPEEAVKHIGKALRLNAGDPESHINLGLALVELGRQDQALDAFSAAARIDPRNPKIWTNLGNVLVELNRLSEAVERFKSALALDPRNVDCLCNLSGALGRLARLPQAQQAAEQAIALAPASAVAHSRLGEVLLRRCCYTEAIASYKRAVQLAEGDLDAKVNLACAYRDAGDAASAETTLRELIQQHPSCAAAHFTLGVLLEQKGDRTQAAAELIETLALNPALAMAHYQLAQLRGHQPTDEEIDAMRNLLARAPASTARKRDLCFGLARAFEKRGDFPEAMKYFDMGHRSICGSNSYDDSKIAALYSEIMRVFPSSSMPVTAKAGENDHPVPVFVVGMPRSGTSLVEQILASHPDVFGAGESSFLQDAVDEACKVTGRAFPRCAQELTEAQCTAIGKSYLDRLKSGHSDFRYIVDKTPMNFQYIGLVRMILPAARFIHCVRDPLDLPSAV